jgi:hypothetical protein
MMPDFGPIEQLALPCMQHHLLSKYGPYVNGIEIFNAEGLHIILSGTPPIDIDELEADLNAHGWLFHKSRVIAEPRYTSRLCIAEGTSLYHASPRRNRASISGAGLLLGRGGGTRLNRSYPSRLFFARDLLSVEGFTQHRLDENSQNVTDFDFYQVVTTPREVFYRDTFFPTDGVWCEMPIPAGRVRRLP